MLSKILLGVSLASMSVAGFLYWNNSGLRDDIATLELRNSALSASLATQKELREAAEEAADVLRVQRAQAEVRARRADKIREAILENDDETLSTVDGPLGAALGLLRDAECSCDTGGAGIPDD